MDESNEHFCDDDSWLESFGEVYGRDCSWTRQIKETLPGEIL